MQIISTENYSLLLIQPLIIIPFSYLPLLHSSHPWLAVTVISLVTCSSQVSHSEPQRNFTLSSGIYFIELCSYYVAGILFKLRNKVTINFLFI